MSLAGLVAAAWPIAAFDPSLAPFVAMVAFGFGIGILGHLFAIDALVWIGILIVFAGLVIVPVIVFGNPY